MLSSCNWLFFETERHPLSGLIAHWLRLREMHETNDGNVQYSGILCQRATPLATFIFEVREGSFGFRQRALQGNPLSELIFMMQWPGAMRIPLREHVVVDMPCGTSPSSLQIRFFIPKEEEKKRFFSLGNYDPISKPSMHAHAQNLRLFRCAEGQ